MSRRTTISRRTILRTTPLFFGATAGCTGGEDETTPTTVAQTTTSGPQQESQATPTEASQTESPTSTPSYEDALAALREKAEEEGTVFVRGTQHPTIEPLIGEVFEENTNAEFQISGGPIIKQIAQSVTEMEVGKLRADIISPTDPKERLLAMQEDAMMTDIMPPSVKYGQAPDGFNPDWDPDDMWLTGAGTAVVLAYNSELVSEDEAPQTFDELLDPKWEDSVLADDDGLISPMLKLLHLRGSWDEAVEYMGDFKPQIKRLTSSSFRSTLDVGQGNAKFFISAPINLVRQIGQDQNVSLGYTILDDLVWLKLRSFGIFKDAPHPNAAKLYLEYLTWEDTQRRVQDEQHYLPVNFDLLPDRITEKMDRGDTVFYNPPYLVGLTEQTGLSIEEMLNEYQRLIGAF